MRHSIGGGEEESARHAIRGSCVRLKQMKEEEEEEDRQEGGGEEEEEKEGGRSRTGGKNGEI